MASIFLHSSNDLDHMIPLSTISTLAKLQEELDSSFWRPDEIKFEKDLAQWRALIKEERIICENAILEFNIWDNEVSKVYGGIGDTFVQDITLPQLSMLYTQIASWEVIHARSYALMGVTLLGKDRMKGLINESTRPKYITKKAKWFAKSMKSRSNGVTPEQILHDHARRVTVTCAVEGLFFQPKFASIYWLKKKGKMPAFSFANELISRDEGLHMRIAAVYLELLGWPLTLEETQIIFSEACELECEGIMETHPDGLSGLSKEELCQYTRYICDYLLKLVFDNHPTLKHVRVYNVKNPFPWMISTSAPRQTSFFEKDVSDYESRTIQPQRKLELIEGHW